MESEKGTASAGTTFWNEKYWLAVNAIGIFLFLLIVSQIWTPPGIPGGPGDGLFYLLYVFPLCVIFLMINVAWLIKIIIHGFALKKWLPVAFWIVVLLAWILAFYINASHTYSGDGTSIQGG